MSRLFGTDGIRGPFGKPPLDQPTVTRLGLCLGEHLRRAAGTPGTVVVGGDTRHSTPRLSAWLREGLSRAGAASLDLGVVPTPAVAWVTRHRQAAAGVAISASHNLPPDNGIKLIASDGFKWPTNEERALEEALLRSLERPLEAPSAPLASQPAAATGDGTEPSADAVRAYLEALAGSVSGASPLSGLHLVVDTAHGAAAPFAEELFRRLGARVEVICASPDGHNINRGCGSTHPAALEEAVRRAGADLGVAFDGDADRALLVDETGATRDGDCILYLWARSLARQGHLEPPAVVATSMSNLGLERALASEGIRVVRCDVGDRVVVETLRRDGLRLGGEQSGHIVHLDLSTTGDGLLTAVQVAALVHREGQPLSALLAGYRRFPQVLLNVRVAEKRDLGQLASVQEAVRSVEGELGSEGRLVLRYSGTEPLARIMIEGPEQGAIQAQAERIAEALQRELGESR